MTLLWSSHERVCLVPGPITRAVLEPAAGLLAELVLDRAADGLEAVEVFDLDDGCLDEVAVTECEVAVDVGLEPHVALLQHTLARAEEAADVAEGLAEDDDLFGGLKVWLRHHFEQGGSGAVEVEDGMVDRAATGVHRAGACRRPPRGGRG